MPSKGSPVVKARCPQALYDDLLAYIVQHNQRQDVEPWSISDAVVAALIELVHHQRRGRGIAGPRPKSRAPDPGERRILECDQTEID